MRIYYTLNGGARRCLNGTETELMKQDRMGLPEGATDVYRCDDGMPDNPLSEMLNEDIKDAILDFLYDNFLDRAIEGWAADNGYDIEDVTARYSDQKYGVNDIVPNETEGHCISCAHFGRYTKSSIRGLCNNNENAECSIADSCAHYLEDK